MRLRLDANGAWSVPDALVVLGGLHERGVEIEHIEDPVGSLAELAGLVDERGCAAGTGTPIAVDQPIADDPRPETIAAATAVAARVVLKPALVGGPLAALALAGEAHRRGAGVVVTSAIDAAVGRTMALHVAAALPGQALACGLLTGDLFALDVGRTDPPSEGRLRVPLDRPGLGIDVAVP